MVTEYYILNDPDTSRSNSLIFLYKSSHIAISYIAYTRKLFPEDAFTDKKFQGHHLKLLKMSKNASMKIMVEWLKTAFTLIVKKYLGMLVFVIEDEQSGSIIQTFEFNYDYSKEMMCYNFESQESGTSQQSSVNDATAASIIQLLRSIHSQTSQMKPSADHTYSLRLVLNDNAPDDFQPPNLYIWTKPSDITFHKNTKKWNLSNIPSKFTTFSVLSNSVFLQDEKDEEEDNSFDLFSLISESDSEIGSRGASPDDPRAKLSSSSLQEPIVTCICDCDDKFDDIITCVSCNMYQHKSCYNLPPHCKEDSHICIDCHNPDRGKNCSVPELITNVNRKAEALYRLALKLCLTETQISATKLMTYLKLGRKKAQEIMDKLMRDGCLHLASGRYGKQVDVNHVKKYVYHRYFTTSLATETEEMRDEIFKKFDLPERKTKINTILKLREEQEQTVYCLCQSTDISKFMIGCEKCDEWYHGDCIGLEEEDAKFIKNWYCFDCIEKHRLKVVYFPHNDKKSSNKRKKDKKQMKRDKYSYIRSGINCGKCSNCLQNEVCGNKDYAMLSERPFNHNNYKNEEEWEDWEEVITPSPEKKHREF